MTCTFAPHLGSYSLRALSPSLISDWQANLVRAGVGTEAIRKAHTLLGNILQRACERERIATNPSRLVRRLELAPRRLVRPLAPSTVEQMRSACGLRDATLLSVLAYAGLRPGEALALTWEHVRARTLLIERALSPDGQFKTTKTRAHRSVRLLAPLRADLTRWRTASADSPAEALVFPRRDGQPWTAADWGNWRNRVYKPTAEAAGAANSRPYDLRHSFCSLLIAEGATAVEVAAQLGHSPALTWGTYSHVFEELSGADRQSAEDVIRAARAPEVSEKCPPNVVDLAARRRGRRTNWPVCRPTPEWAVQGSNLRLPACKYGERDDDGALKSCVC